MSFLTIAGEEQLANKQGNGERVNIAKFVLAYRPDQGNEPEDRVESVPDDAFIVDTRAYTKRSYVNGNQVVYSLVMDSSVGDFTFNWIGLVDDENVLIAVAHITAIDKTKSSEGVRGNTIARNFLLKYTGIQNLTATTIPAETWQLDFNGRLAGIDERERLSNFDIFGHESFLSDAWKVTGSKGAYQIATGVGYVGGIRVENQDDTLTKTFDYPNQLWLNVSLQGDVSDRSAVVEFIMDSGDFKDYEDDNGITHYLTKLADIADDGSVIDARTVYENVAQHEAKADPHPQYKAYTDDALTSAKAYSDNLLVASKSYTDGLDALNVKLTDAQSVAGRKTFSVAPRSSVAPTNNADLARKDYVDDMGSATLSSAQTFAEAQANTALASAKDYVGETIGSIHFFATQIAPEGFIKANGATLQIDSFPELHAKIGTTFGGDGIDTFALPDLRGEFVRGYDDGRGVDAGRGFGSWQADEIVSHRHSMSAGWSSDGASSSSVMTDEGDSGTRTNYTNYNGGDETRPRNIALAAYIKY